MIAVGRISTSQPHRHLSQGYGALLLTTESAENGEVWQASVIRVQLLP